MRNIGEGSTLCPQGSSSSIVASFFCPNVSSSPVAMRFTDLNECSSFPGNRLFSLISAAQVAGSSPSRRRGSLSLRPSEGRGLVRSFTAAGWSIQREAMQTLGGDEDPSRQIRRGRASDVRQLAPNNVEYKTGQYLSMVSIHVSLNRVGRCPSGRRSLSSPFSGCSVVTLNQCPCHCRSESGQNRGTRFGCGG
jgi:hypothetical protein